MLVVDLFSASDSRNNLISTYKQIYKHTYCLCPGTCVLSTSLMVFSEGSSRRARVHLPCHDHRKSLFRDTKAFNPPTMAWASLWNDTCCQWVRVEVDSRTFDSFVRPLFSEFPGRPFDRPGWMKYCYRIFFFNGFWIEKRHSHETLSLLLLPVISLFQIKRVSGQQNF